MNARSYNIFTVDTDHRLVLVTLYRETDPQRGKGTPKESKTEDKVLLELRLKKAQIRQKLSQVKPEKIPHLKRERNRVSNAIQKRKAFLATKQLIDDALEINQAKDNAQASLALKKLLKEQHRGVLKKEKISASKLSDHFQQHFTDPHAADINKTPPGFIKLPSDKEVGSFPFVPPSLVGAYYLQPPDTRAIFLHNDLLCNDTCSVTGGSITYWGGTNGKNPRSDYSSEKAEKQQSTRP